MYNDEIRKKALQYTEKGLSRRIDKSSLFSNSFSLGDGKICGKYFFVGEKLVRGKFIGLRRIFHLHISLGQN